LEFHEADEMELVEKFTNCIQLEPFSPPLPAWAELQRTRPDWCTEFLAALEPQQL
jgi:hypothetical protein